MALRDGFCVSNRNSAAYGKSMPYGRPYGARKRPVRLLLKQGRYRSRSSINAVQSDKLFIRRLIDAALLVK